MMKTRFLSRLWKPGYLFFDRYTLDVVIEMMVATDIPNPLKSFALRALLSFPCPQLCVNLDVDENIAQARKKDEIHTAEWLKARRVVYRSITSRFSYLQMDSSRPQSELADSIMSIILKGKQE
jgi:thymidylate kinase